MDNLKRHYFSLLELLIAISLLAVLLTSLFGIYRYIDEIQKGGKVMQQKNFRLLYVQYRLQKVLPAAYKKTNGKDFYFYTTYQNELVKSSQSLVFTYDNGITTPEFAGDVLGKIFVDEEGNLCLVTWTPPAWNSSPIPPMRKEILLSDVESISFSFYIGPKNEKIKKVVDPESELAYKKWHSQWPVDGVDPDQVSLPALLKIRVIMKKTSKEKEPLPLDFAFVLPDTEQNIQYWGF